MSKEEEIILKYALKNAVSHDGAPQQGPVISGFLGEMPEHKAELKQYLPIITKTVKKVGTWNPERQKQELLKLDSKALDKKVEEKKLSSLPNVVVGSFRTRIPPGVEKFLHIGHAISFTRNYLYAKQYRGEAILRMEDTNPLTPRKEFYQAIRDDLAWLGIKCSKELIQSQRMPVYYRKAEELMKKGKAFVCTCSREQIKKGRWDKKNCACRKNASEQNLDLWKQMQTTTREGEAILRFKGNMKDNDASLRDPTLFRIIDHSHTLTGTRYRVWPSYDFAAAVDDGSEKITHVIRTNEFATSLQKRLIKELGYKVPTYVEYGRFTLIGTVVKGREIRKLGDDKVVEGWDDPRLATIAGIRRRGILPETIAALCYEVGISKARGRIEMDFIYSLNRKILNDRADRKFLVPNPVKITVKNAPATTATIPNHPSIEEKGFRQIKTSGTFYIDKEDAKNKEVFRLKDLYNIQKKGTDWVYAGKELVKDLKKIQWATPDAVEVTVLHPESLLKNDKLNLKSRLRPEKCLAEPSVQKIKTGEIVQFERYGFCRKDGENTFIFSHE